MVTEPLRLPVGTAAVPSLVEVLADPTILDRLPASGLLDLRRQVGYLTVDLDTAIMRHNLRADHRPSQADTDRLLSPEEAANAFGVKKRWLLEHADEIPGVRRLSKKVIRFSERALRRHLAGLKA